MVLSATVMHAATNHLVDAVLALILMIGGVIAAQFGARMGQKMRGERLLLGLLIFRGRLPFRLRTRAARPSLFASLREAGMMRRIALVLIFLAAAGVSGPASAERLVVSLSNHRVAVTSNFVGEELVLFGTIEPNSAAMIRLIIVITVSGPRQTIRTRRKQRMAGIWVTSTHANSSVCRLTLPC